MMTDYMKIENQVFEAKVGMVAEDVTLPKEPCLLDGMLEPCILVILGASGDHRLRTRKHSLGFA